MPWLQLSPIKSPSSNAQNSRGEKGVNVTCCYDDVRQMPPGSEPLVVVPDPEPFQPPEVLALEGVLRLGAPRKPAPRACDSKARNTLGIRGGRLQTEDMEM
jgi:hypothetical protein